MFQIGNYKVEFRHKNEKDSAVFYHKKSNPNIVALTYCMIKDPETLECISAVKLFIEKGENLSKNSRRKRTLAKCLQNIYPSNGNPHKSFWNKKARTLFWQEYFKKRGKI